MIIFDIVLHHDFCYLFIYYVESSTALGRMSPLARARIVFASVVCLMATTPRAIDIVTNPEVVAHLKTTNTHLDRIALFPNQTDRVYESTIDPLHTWTPGSVCNANTATFPVRADLGMTLAMPNNRPCSILPPHLQPRATNLMVAIASSMSIYMLQENSAQTIATNLTPEKTTVLYLDTLGAIISVISSCFMFSSSPTNVDLDQTAKSLRERLSSSMRYSLI